MNSGVRDESPLDEGNRLQAFFYARIAGNARVLRSPASARTACAAFTRCSASSLREATSWYQLANQAYPRIGPFTTTSARRAANLAPIDALRHDNRPCIRRRA